MNSAQIRDSLINTLTIEAKAIETLITQFDSQSFEAVVRVIGDCPGRIVTVGAGTSGAAAKKIAHSLCCIERPAFFLSPADAVHGALGAVQPGDCVIAISKGGSTREIVNMLGALKAKGVTLIGVTEKPDSVLGTQSDICLKIKVEREPDAFNMLATASTLAVVAVFDAVCIALMQYTNYTREQFSIIHPGGAVGERLLGKNA